MGKPRLIIRVTPREIYDATLEGKKIFGKCSMDSTRLILKLSPSIGSQLADKNGPLRRAYEAAKASQPYPKELG